MPKLQSRLNKKIDKDTGKTYESKSYLMIPPKHLIEVMNWKEGDELLYSRLDDKSIKVEKA